MNDTWHEMWREKPPVRGQYLVTVRDDLGKMVDIDLWTGHEWFEHTDSVRAWMPLPEPYSIYSSIGGNR